MFFFSFFFFIFYFFIFALLFHFACVSASMQESTNEQNVCMNMRGVFVYMHACTMGDERLCMPLPTNGKVDVHYTRIATNIARANTQTMHAHIWLACAFHTKIAHRARHHRSATNVFIEDVRQNMALNDVFVSNFSVIFFFVAVFFFSILQRNWHPHWYLIMAEQCQWIVYNTIYWRNNVYGVDWRNSKWWFQTATSIRLIMTVNILMCDHFVLHGDWSNPNAIVIADVKIIVHYALWMQLE